MKTLEDVLTDRQKIVIRLRDEELLTYQAIGDRYKVGRERIRSIYDHAKRIIEHWNYVNSPEGQDQRPFFGVGSRAMMGVINVHSSNRITADSVRSMLINGELAPGKPRGFGRKSWKDLCWALGVEIPRKKHVHKPRKLTKKTDYDIIREAINQRTADIHHMRVVLNKSLNEVATSFGICKERTRQIVRNAERILEQSRETDPEKIAWSKLDTRSRNVVTAAMNQAGKKEFSRAVLKEFLLNGQIRKKYPRNTGAKTMKRLCDLVGLVYASPIIRRPCYSQVCPNCGKEFPKQ